MVLGDWPDGFVPQLWPDRKRLSVFVVPDRSMKQIITAVAEAYGFTYQELVGNRRFKSLSRARFAAMDACRKTGFWSTTQIGLAMNRDHSTIVSGLQRHAALARQADAA